MSENTADQVDPIKNVKEEMNRKLGNTEAQLSELKKANELLLAKMSELAAATKKPEPAPKKQELSDLLYDNPEAYAAEVEKRAEARIMERLQAANAGEMARQKVLGELYNDFPELSDNGSELTKKAVELYASLDDDSKKSPSAYRLAVKEAALELGMKPKSKRPVDDEPMGGNSGRSSTRQKPNKLSPEVEEFAQIMGLDTSDPKVKESLIKRSGRNWSKFEKVG